MKRIAALLLITGLLIMGCNFLEDDQKPNAKPDTKANPQEDAVIIKIETNEAAPKTVFLSPPNITIAKNTIVIWVNFIDGPELNIVFDDADAAMAASKDQKGFYLDTKGAFAAKYMPFIATSSVRFVQNGSFGYSIQSQDGTKVTAGIVNVK
jgi:hypothetical protein